MGQAIPRQHPAVVLRSQFNKLRALLAIALVALAGLTAALVIMATDDDTVTDTASPSVSAPAQSGTTRSDGGPEEGTRGIAPARQPTVDASHGARSDGGPEEGSADVTPAQPRVTQQNTFPGLADQAREAQPEAGTRPDGGPEEGSHLR